MKIKRFGMEGENPAEKRAAGTCQLTLTSDRIDRPRTLE